MDDDRRARAGQDVPEAALHLDEAVAMIDRVEDRRVMAEQALILELQVRYQGHHDLLHAWARELGAHHIGEPLSIAQIHPDRNPLVRRLALDLRSANLFHSRSPFLLRL